MSIACLAFFARAFAGHWQSLGTLDWRSLFGVALLPAALLYLGTYALAAKAWQLGLGMFDGRMSFARSARILLLSQIGKYLPGNLGHHVGRVLLARRAGLPSDAVVASMLADTLLVLVAGVLCSLPAAGLLAAAAGHAGGMHPVLQWGAPLALAGMLALLASRRIRQQLRQWLPATFRPSPPALAGLLACHVLSFALGAAALYLLCEALGAPEADAGAAQVLGTYAAAWVLGFLMPGSPAGLGVRELVLLLGLGPLYGEGTAATATALLRLATTAADGLAFLAGAALSRRGTR
jgi:uncharacterized membrane protein YbhN (UPF0104 family)